ncbi:hypothetical protein ATO12_09950 [Aquimarina atlantica]|uniref:DUF481 domain-containing protein n=1 Tax=Aquimarina atlantica TaxID=1317122 RepID=A0A023BYH7_9FLAO|nr:hypothetical protein [Aquimarina atlantica]EZH75040.1 hypothetical protein ATO12_09950 [Aquimarina atlantica]
MKHIILIITFIICADFSYSQGGNFLNRITLRKSFQSKNDKAKSANFTYTNPKNKSESWLLNAAIGVNVLNDSNEVVTLSPYIEYHKNTLVDKEQDNWQTGLALEWQTRDISIKKWTPILISSLKYNEDEVKDISSFQGNLYVTAIAKGKAKKAKFFYIPNTIVDIGRIFQFVYSPYIGLENENRISAEEILSEGNIYRALLRLTSNISLFPSCDNWKDKFEFNIDWQYRYILSEDVDNFDKEQHNFFTASFNYMFFSIDDGKKTAKIGIDYTDGEDPTKNFEEQSFYAVSLKVKF